MTIYDSAKRKHPAIEELIAIIRYRDLIYQLVRRDIVARYKRSVLGVAWTMLNPLGIMIVMTIVFSQLFGQIESFPVYILTGLICWSIFTQSTTFAISSMVWGSSLLQQIYLPRTSFVVASILANVVNFVLSLIPLALIMLATGVPIRLSVLMLPYSMLLITAFSLGFSLLISSLAVFFPDIAEIFPVILRAWMYLTPIIVPTDLLRNVLNGWILRLNPFYHILDIFRQLVYEGIFPSLRDWGIAFFISFTMFIIGWVFFTKKADTFAYQK